MTTSAQRTRRQFITIAGGAVGAVALSSCNTSPRTSGGAQSSGAGAPTGGTGGTGALKWWDQFNPLEKLQRKTFAAFTAAGGPNVDYTVYNPNEQGKALQLAFSSKQLPDVFSLAGVQVPPSVLLSQGWFAPLSTADEITAALPKDSLIDGVHKFGGKLYSFSIFSPRQYDALVWGNKTLLDKAGVDPENLPTGWDDLRAAAQKIKKSGTSGLVLPLKFVDRMQAFVLQLAQAAGFPGVLGSAAVDGINVKTGEYAYHDDAFVQAIDFLRSFQKDGLLFPASTSLDARAGRARWVAGAAALFLDGPYCAGVVANNFKPFLDKLTVAGIPTPDGGQPVLSHAPTGGTFWVSGQSKQTDKASKLLVRLTQKDYQSGLAEAMDQPPLDPAAVASSDAHPTYKKAIQLFGSQVFLGPTPEARKPEVAKVIGAMKQPQPSLGAIVQGAFSGQVKDVRAALKKLSDDSSAAREAAMSKGQGVSAADWAFADWSPGKDFTAADYQK